MFGRKRFRLATAVILTLMLTIALAPVAAAQDVGVGPPPVDVPTDTDDSGEGEVTPLPSVGGGNGGTTPLPDGGNGGTTPLPDGGNGGTTPLPGGGDGGTTPLPGGNGGTMTPPAPSWPPPNSNLIVRHAATQVQLISVGDGLQTYFVGLGGVGHSGPYISSFSSLAQQYLTGGAVTLFSGANPGTGKPITIYYLPAENKIRVSTYYPDTQYDTNKPYVFTVDSGHNVVHDQW